jgi:hypothetical protein
MNVAGRVTGDGQQISLRHGHTGTLIIPEALIPQTVQAQGEGQQKNEE